MLYQEKLTRNQNLIYLTFLCSSPFVDTGASNTVLQLVKTNLPDAESSDKTDDSFMLANSSPSWEYFAFDPELGVSK